MKQPTSVAFCGLRYKIVYVDDLGDRLGQIDFQGQPIKILSGNSAAYTLRTLLHEMVHGVVQNLSVRELMDDDGKHMEHPIDQIANGIAEALESSGLVKLEE